MPKSASRRNLPIARISTVLATAVLSTALISPHTAAAQAAFDDQTRKLAHDIFQQLIEINTTDSVGNVTTASRAIQQRLLDAGFAPSDMYLGGPNDRKENLVVRYRGTGKQKPILFIGHLDVVEARREDWTTDPFKFVEKDGYFYGRGTQDMKEGDAILATTFIRFKQEGYKPDRDLILAFTADEEGGKSNGVDWLLKNHRDLMEAAYVLNPDGGGVEIEHGKPVSMDVEATEKLYVDYQLTVTNPGGHSSLPVPDNAIYHLAGALVNLQHYQFPFELNSVTRAYFERLSTIETGDTAADLKAITQPDPNPDAIARLSKNPEWNSMMHTTCVATRLQAGHANNALPQIAQANVNCRILPGHSLEEIRQQLISIFADPKVTVRYVNDAGGVFDMAPDANRFRRRRSTRGDGRDRIGHRKCGPARPSSPRWPPAPPTAFTPTPPAFPATASPASPSRPMTSAPMGKTSAFPSSLSIVALISTTSS